MTDLFAFVLFQIKKKYKLRNIIDKIRYLKNILGYCRYGFDL